MDQHEYNELCIRLKGKLTEFSVDFTELMLLLEAIRTLADHPDFHGLELRGKLGGMRETILGAFEGLGLTTSQIHDLDAMFASDAMVSATDDEKAYYEFAKGNRDKSHLKILDPQEAKKIREEIDATANRLLTFLNEKEKEEDE